MFAVTAQITKCIDETSIPTYVECQFVDAHGRVQIFHDKDAIFCSKALGADSKYPVDAVVGCEIMDRSGESGEIVKVNTGLPWHIESIDGQTIFEVRRQQIVQFDHPQSEN